MERKGLIKTKLSIIKALFFSYSREEMLAPCQATAEFLTSF